MEGNNQSSGTVKTNEKEEKKKMIKLKMKRKKQQLHEGTCVPACSGEGRLLPGYYFPVLFRIGPESVSAIFCLIVCFDCLILSILFKS